MTDEPAWWKEAVVYQVYPRSFNDSGGNGLGDLRGIIERLDYIDALGVDAVWLNPIYDSPQEDHGYDVASYRDIHPPFGTMADWTELKDGLHERDIRLIMDMVVNHTSVEHEWFQRSRENPDGPYGDYYIWRDGDPDDPPTNWESFFGGSAWEYDDVREAWYLHLYDVSQPDLNWANPAVRADVFETMNWWVEKGIDGFRLDVINLLSKPEGLPDGDPNSDWIGSEHFVDGPAAFEYLQQMHANVFDDADLMTIGEMPDVTVEEARKYVGPDGPLDMLFSFDHVVLDHGEHGRWDIGDLELTDLKRAVWRWQTGLVGHGWNTVFFENHDIPRSVSRYGDEAYRYESATLLGTLLLTLRGTPFIYQGQELGMTNGSFPSFDALRDVDTIRNVRVLMERRDIEEFSAIKELVEYRSRDNARMPMQWDDTEHAGFTTGEPWIGVNDNYVDINVADQQDREDSVLAQYRQLVALRDAHDVFVYGDLELLLPEDEQLFVYTRIDAETKLLVVLNVDDQPVTVPDLDVTVASLLYSNYDDAPTDPTNRSLSPYQACVYEC